MKALRSFPNQQFFSKHAAHDTAQLLIRQPRRQFASSSRKITSYTPSTTAASTANKPSLNYNTLRSLLFRRSPRPQQHRLNSTKSDLPQTPSQPARPSPDPTPNLNSPTGSQHLSLTQRLRKLSREYGWSALGVYLALSALDFPFCFAAVRMLGVERIGHWEHVIVNTAKDLLKYPFPDGTFARAGAAADDAPHPVTVAAVSAEDSEQVAQPGAAQQEWSWGVEEAEMANNQGATIWTQLALAYAIHKSFIFLRVPLTAAVTPKVVRVLRGWGWDIGKRKPKVQK